MKTYILYHGNCFDGFGAAYAAWKKFGNDAQYIACNYGEAFPTLEPGSDVYMIDFSGPRELMINLFETMNKFVVLDHHKTAEENLKGLDFAHFDMKKSGAMLAWEYFHPASMRPLLIDYIQDRDLWNKNLPMSDEVSACIASYPYSFTTWDTLAKTPIEVLQDEGVAIQRYSKQVVEMICNQATVKELFGHKVAVTNSTSHWSEVGASLLKKFPEADFAASYFDDKAGFRKWSLRSNKNFDVSAVAKTFGGGGHAQAAGFQTSLP